MCGIVGWYRRGGKPVPAQALGRPLNILRHRGPDDVGELIDGDFGFGMRRLSIMDVEGGHQPISSEDGRYTIIFNGEIVNHLTIRKDLESGFSFRTRSDAETILASYIRWGNDAWIRLEGMYAAAIWDRRTRTLTLARDPLGIKPLYLTQQRGGLAFASEITALRALPHHEFDLDERGVHDFFSFGHVLTPRSIFSQVRSLEPGHTLVIGPTGEPVTTQFWRPHLSTRTDISETDWINETRARVLQTVDSHLLADVPVGAFLSGGVDSGAIAAAMAQRSSRPFKAFTAGFPNSSIDETKSARRVAQHLRCEHIVLPIEPVTAADVLPQVQRAFDEPTAANSAVPLWYLSRAAAEHVKVVLCGEGGDELFMGYKRQRSAQAMQKWGRAIRAVGGLGFIDHIPNVPFRKMNYLRQRVQRFRDSAMLKSGYEQFFAAVTITSPALRKRLYEPDFWQRQDAPSSLHTLRSEYFSDDQGRILRPLEEFMLGDLTVHMPSSLLNRLDRSSMAHSLEARVPFLSHQFVDWALTVPLELKLRGDVGKYVLRKAVEPWLPPGALTGKKLGFQMPLADWFTGDFNGFAWDAWQSSGAADAGYLNSAAVEQIFDEHRSGKFNHGRVLYALAMFGCWWKEQRRAPSPPSSLEP